MPSSYLRFFFIEEDVENLCSLTIDAYNERIHTLADDFEARLVRTNEAFDKVIAARPGA